MSFKNNFKIQAYQPLFLIGILHALFGTFIWVLYALKLIDYPGYRHADHMIGGFLFSFVAGFLLTAIPNFTGTSVCSKKELLIASSLALAALIFGGNFFTTALLIFLVIFFIGRLSKRIFKPPPQFIFLPFGLLSGIFGGVTLCLIDNQIIDIKFMPIGKLFYYYAAILNIIIGVGSKLIPALLGWAPPPTPASLVEGSNNLNQFQRKFPIILAILLFLSFLIEFFGRQDIGRILRSLIATIIAFKVWRLYLIPPQKTKMAFWLWISAWFLVVGLWVHALFPELNIHAAHLFFVGGFGMMTTIISSRVILSHGNYGLDIESKSKIYAFCSLMFMLAAITRFSAPWTPNYINHLGYAAACWIIAMLVWCVIFIPKIFNR